VYRAHQSHVRPWADGNLSLAILSAQHAYYSETHSEITIVYKGCPGSCTGAKRAARELRGDATGPTGQPGNL